MRKEKKYRVVEKFPKDAVTVEEYSDSCGYYDNSGVYKLWRRHVATGRKIDFEIISFKGRNFILPKPPK
jgi:hypothetical protein